MDLPNFNGYEEIGRNWKGRARGDHKLVLRPVRGRGGGGGGGGEGGVDW